MRVFILVFLCCAVISTSSAVPSDFARIIGGTPTTIDNYPSLAGFLRAHDGLNFMHNCGGSILNERNILTAAHCNSGAGTSIYRVRVGSTFGNSGGVVHNIIRIINHPNYSPLLDSDIAIIHTATHITLNQLTQRATIAGPNFIVPDNEEVWAAGWGIMENNVKPEQVRHVPLVTMNQAQCGRIFSILTDNMICAGPFSNQASAGQCSSDSGGPLYYRNVVVGVCSFTQMPCGRPDSASVSARVSRFTSWILENTLS